MKNSQKLQPGDVYAAAVETLPAQDIEHYCSDLYLRHTPAATALINQLENKALLSTFTDQRGCLWYELPFCFIPFWENPSKYY